MNQVNSSLSEQIALSFDAQASPGISLRGQADAQADLLPMRWGLVWYPDNQRAATLIHNVDLPPGITLSSVLESQSSARSSLFIGCTQEADPDVARDDVSLFQMTYAGRKWVFSSTGSLSLDVKSQLSLDEDFDIAPVGARVEEHAFRWIVSQLREREAKTIDQFGWRALHDLMKRLNAFGAASFLLSDGLDLVAYRDETDRIPLYWTRRTPPHQTTGLDGRSFAVDLHDSPMDGSRTCLAFSTLPMRGSAWTPLEAGELRVVRRGTSVWSSHPSGILERSFAFAGGAHAAPRDTHDVRFEAATQQQFSIAPNAESGEPALMSQASRSAMAAELGSDLPESRETEESKRVPFGERPAEESHSLLSVYHETKYTYAEAVERSSHRFCLHPVRDERQEVLEHELEITVDGVGRSFEDVFGNRVSILEVDKPFTEMKVTSRAKVRVENVVASHLKSPLRRDQIPLAWMPWQRQMMQAYLTPPELPEPELLELSEFGMSFVERNDYDLVETLLDMNRTIYRDFEYVSGSTSIETTPFQVYAARKGVCQDFANVLICLARLLDVPARYRVGYIYTGGSYENKIQSDASHAWAEVYLPWMGWFGFDPTNGCLAGSDHVRLACGRHFRDAAPTTGTIYRGGGGEHLWVDVRVEQMDGDPS